MPFFIGAECIDSRDMSCVDECPVDCIYEGNYKLYINPAECIDCGACEPACPVDAIAVDRRVPDELTAWRDDNARFFTEILPGRTEPVGNPGGARKAGPIDADTELATATAAATE
ncbi:MAG TPA: ferredoxin [Streptosporangiaceae bacterium]|jgi:NAD-dependent dihydropyrimidine dehydrogenase PreA subunit